MFFHRLDGVGKDRDVDAVKELSGYHHRRYTLSSFDNQSHVAADRSNVRLLTLTTLEVHIIDLVDFLKRLQPLGHRIGPCPAQGLCHFIPPISYLQSSTQTSLESEDVLSGGRLERRNWL